MTLDELKKENRLCKYFDSEKCKETGRDCKKGDCPILDDAHGRAVRKTEKKRKAVDPKADVKNLFEGMRQIIKEMSDASGTIHRSENGI